MHLSCNLILNGYFDRNESGRFGGEKVLDESLFADERDGVVVVGLEELDQLVGGGQRFEDFQRHEQGNSPGSILIGQRYHHVRASRPNVQVARIHRKLYTTQIICKLIKCSLRLYRY